MVTVAQCLWPCVSVQRALVGITLEAMGYQFTPEHSFSSIAISLQISVLSHAYDLHGFKAWDNEGPREPGFCSLIANQGITAPVLRMLKNWCFEIV